MLEKYINHIPEALYSKNTNVVKFINIIQALQDIVDAGVFSYGRGFSPLTADTIEWVRKFVDDFGGDYLLQTQRKTLECLYLNKNYIYSRKGTKEALERILTCFISPFGCYVDSITYTNSYPLIHRSSQYTYKTVPQITILVKK